MPPEKSRYAVQAIERGARAEAQLVESLLDLSRIMSRKLHLEMERLDLGSVVNAAYLIVPDWTPPQKNGFRLPRPIPTFCAFYPIRVWFFARRTPPYMQSRRFG